MVTPYVEFVPALRFETKTPAWDARSTKTNLWLGTVRWYAPWRRYCFRPADVTVFDAACLREIETFLTAQMEARRGNA